MQLTIPFPAAAFLAGLTGLIAIAPCPASAYDGWHLERSTIIEGKGAAWDYITLDATRRRLFIGHRKEGLQVFDLDAGILVTTIPGTPAASSNGAVLIPEFDLGLSNNENGTLTPFRLSTLEAQPAIKLGAELDTSHYDSFHKRLVVNMAAGADGTDAIVLAIPSLAQVGTIRLATRKMEGADGDGIGNFFVAARDVNTVFRLDIVAGKVTAEWPTPGCAQTNSLTIDRVNKRIFLGCRGSETVKPSFAVMDAGSGVILYTAEIGGGNDSIVYDADLKRIFLANGVGAMLNVFEQVSADVYRPVEALGTSSGVRALAIDPTHKKLYSVVAEGAADMAKKIVTTVSPFYANSFFPNTFRVLTFSR